MKANLDPIFKLYLKPLTKYFTSNIKEVIMNKPQEVVLEDLKGKWSYKTDKELNLKWAEEFAKAMGVWTGQKVGEEHPTLSFRLPKTGDKKQEQGGHRVQIFFGNICGSGFSMSIRLNRGIIFDIEKFNFSKEDQEQVIDFIKNKKTVLISGGTGTGKTSLLNSLFKYVSLDERLITIEGVSELKPPHRNCTSLFYSENQTSSGNRTVADLLNESLRARPDRVILGELRKENSFVFLRAINTGHEGSMATVHANNPQEAISALIDNMIMNGDIAEGAMTTCRNRLLSNIAGVVQMTRGSEGKIFAYLQLTNNMNFSNDSLRLIA